MWGVDGQKKRKKKRKLAKLSLTNVCSRMIQKREFKVFLKLQIVDTHRKWHMARN